MRKLKLTAISDLHGNLPKPEIFDEGDVLCICGDIAPLDIQRKFVECIAWFGMKFVPWTDKLPFKKVIVIFGNHDFFGEELGPRHFNDGKEITRMLLPGSIKGEHKIEILCDNMYKYGGFTFYGTSWCPDLVNWAFYKDSDELKEVFDKIPFGVDVLLTHCPPRLGNAGVVLQNGGWNFLTNYGCQELAEALVGKNVKYHFYGHVHSGDHRLEELNGTKMANVSMLDENYKMNYSPLNIEIENG